MSFLLYLSILVRSYISLHAVSWQKGLILIFWWDDRGLIKVLIYHKAGVLLQCETSHPAYREKVLGVLPPAAHRYVFHGPVSYSKQTVSIFTASKYLAFCLCFTRPNVCWEATAKSLQSLQIWTAQWVWVGFRRWVQVSVFWRFFLICAHDG